MHPIFCLVELLFWEEKTNRTLRNKRFGEKNRSENEWVGEVRPRCLHLFKGNKLTVLELLLLLLCASPVQPLWKPLCTQQPKVIWPWLKQPDHRQHLWRIFQRLPCWVGLSDTFRYMPFWCMPHSEGLVSKKKLLIEYFCLGLTNRMLLHPKNPN